MKKLFIAFRAICIPLALFVFWAAVPVPVHAATLTVCSSGCDYTSIQAAINAAGAGDTISIAAGTYTEQIIISKNLTLNGAGTGTTILLAPAVLADNHLRTSDGSHVKTILAVNNGATVNLTGITVSGPVNAPEYCSDLMGGVYVYQNAILNFSDSAVTDVRDAIESNLGCQSGLAIRVGEWQSLNNNGTPSAPTTFTPGHATLHNLTITGYQKGGIVVNGAGSTATITNNTVTPYVNDALHTAANGIQVSRGASATVQGNTISNNRCDLASVCGPSLSQDQSAGILLYHAGSGTVISGNTSQNNDIGLYNTNAVPGFAPATVDSNLLTSNRYMGVLLQQGSISLTNNEITGTSLNGVMIDTEADTVTTQVTLSNNIISGAGTGIHLEDQVSGDSYWPDVTANLNSITGNTVDINNEVASHPLNGQHNWWGAALGPGSGVLQGLTTYNPWLCNGTDTHPELVGFQPNASQYCTTTATHLVFTTQPGGGIAGQTIDPQPVVQAQDDAGNLAINFTGYVMVSIANNPGSGVLTGSTTLHAVNGVATFSGLAISKPGTGYTLTASAATLDYAVSNPFNILAASDQADVELTQDAIASVQASAQFSYHLHLTNHGPLAANSLTVTDLLPGTATFVSAGGTGWVCSAASNVVTCYRGSLASGASTEIVITVKAPAAAGTLTNQAWVSALTPDGLLSNNASSQDTTVQAPPPVIFHMIYLPLVMRVP